MAELSKAQILTAGDIGSLLTSLLSKSFVHSLPTRLLLRSHSRIELQHLENPKDKQLQIAHTNLFLEMELRELDHFDTDPSFFTPSHTKWPFDFEPDEIEKDIKFKRKISVSPKRRVRKGRDPYSRARKRRKRSRLFNYIDPQRSKETHREILKRAFGIGPHTGIIEFDTLHDQTHRIFKDKSVKAWNIQPDTGNIPIGIGPRPKKEHWFKTFFPPLGAYQAFMQKTLSAFYRRQTPPWAIQEWDIKLTVTDVASDETTHEKRNFIQASIAPN